MQSAHAMNASHASINTIDASQAQRNSTQIASFADLARNLTPLSEHIIEMAMNQTRADILVEAQVLDAQATNAEMQVTALAEAVNLSHPSQRLRDFVANT